MIRKLGLGIWNSECNSGMGIEILEWNCEFRNEDQNFGVGMMIQGSEFEEKKVFFTEKYIAYVLEIQN